MLLDDRTSGAGDLQLQSIAHGVVRLETLLPEFGGARRRLRVMKLRGVAYADGYHDYVIRTGGLEVFPRLVAAEHRVPYARETVSSGVPALDALVGGGLSRGTSTLIMGPAGSGKSLLASHFVHQAASHGDHAAVFIFDEGADTYFAGTKGVGLDMEALVHAGRLSIQQVDPAEMSPGEFVGRVRDSVERDNARVVMIDSLNGYLNAMPEERQLTLHARAVQLSPSARRADDQRHEPARHAGTDAHPDRRELSCRFRAAAALLRGRGRHPQGRLHGEATGGPP